MCWLPQQSFVSHGRPGRLIRLHRRYPLWLLVRILIRQLILRSYFERGSISPGVDSIVWALGYLWAM